MNTLAFLEELIRIPSITDSAKESEPLSLIKNLLDKEDIAYKIYGKGTKLSLVAQIGRGSKSVLLNGHFDVVPAPEEMFEPGTRDEKLYARGAADAKGPLAAILTAFVNLNKNKPKGKVILCCVSDEENAGEQGTKILAKKGIVGDYNIAGEPTGNNIIITEKGFLRLAITIHGKETHAAFPKQSQNAIYIAAHVVKEIGRIDFKKTHPVLNIPTISFGLISGGTKINVGAGSCEIGIDIRYLPGQSEEEIIKIIEKAIHPICDATIKVIASGIPFETSEDALLVVAAKKATKGSVKGVNFGTDARFYYPKEAIALGPGASELAHQKKEYVKIKDIQKAAKYYEEIVRRCLA